MKKLLVLASLMAVVTLSAQDKKTPVKSKSTTKTEKKNDAKKAEQMAPEKRESTNQKQSPALEQKRRTINTN
ncbi:hypothetical protein NZD85_09295 [Empedobacter stercoris]|jgi:hypothetical protein|uniref:Uncharacterized protein n=2 Tax=Empedobacter TaxID=59734 RepID=A0ABY8V5Y1_9FLAO|nr:MULTISPECIES: hypothetical protein [Empedobacter]MCA4777170.1 hypothetical protein [Empedobacter stercoris]MCA4808754.1 hypothetical protein [Empedobacter stercoris]MDM1523654.1 hypothetical protein [Empedobacter sp. 225-1]MDM1543617.1 hypothetical protein [Empedobacter sp. 189-2]NOJ76112.1 hypothetical protein [Empedobacter stercoris]